MWPSSQLLTKYGVQTLGYYDGLRGTKCGHLCVFEGGVNVIYYQRRAQQQVICWCFDQVAGDKEGSPPPLHNWL